MHRITYAYMKIFGVLAALSQIDFANRIRGRARINQDEARLGGLMESKKQIKEIGSREIQGG